jgi:hypothetical protein
VIRQRRFVHVQTVLLLAIALGLALIDALSYETFLVASLVGFLLVTGLTGPTALTPQWRRRLRLLLLPALLAFGYVVLRHALAVLPPDLVIRPLGAWFLARPPLSPLGVSF